jgi:hypothetical protein
MEGIHRFFNLIIILLLFVVSVPSNEPFHNPNPNPNPYPIPNPNPNPMVGIPWTYDICQKRREFL